MPCQVGGQAFPMLCTACPMAPGCRRPCMPGGHPAAASLDAQGVPSPPCLDAQGVPCYLAPCAAFPAAAVGSHRPGSPITPAGGPAPARCQPDSPRHAEGPSARANTGTGLRGMWGRGGSSLANGYWSQRLVLGDSLRSRGVSHPGKGSWTPQMSRGGEGLLAHGVGLGHRGQHWMQRGLGGLMGFVRGVSP